MKSAVTLGRRNFFLAGFSLPIVAPLYSSKLCPFVNRIENIYVAGQSELNCSSKVIGALYLKQHPEDCDVNRLSSRLGASRSKLDGQIELLGDIPNQIKADYKQGNTTLIDGWVLSRTECRLCALKLLT